MLLRSAILTFFLMLSFLGCGGPKGSSGSSYRFLLPWADANGEYNLKEVQVDTLETPYILRGSIARIFVETSLTSAGLLGTEARPKLIRSNGLYIPADAISSLAVTAYAQMERIFLLDQSLGWGEWLSWPRSIGISIPTRKAHGESENNNARYFSWADVIIINPYSLPNIPLAINPGVLAHEHFHAHFQKLVLTPLNREFEEGGLKSSESREYISLVLRAWNEGLADLYGHIFSGDPEFMAKSISQVDSSFRSLKQEPTEFLEGRIFRELVRQVQKQDRSPIYLSYIEGSKMARFFARLLESQDRYSGEEGKKLFFSDLESALRRLPAHVQEFGDNLEFKDFIRLFYNENKNQKEQSECRLLDALVGKGHFPSCSMEDGL